LFAYIDHKKNDGSLRALTHSAFLYRCNQIWSAADYNHFAGHSFHIGGASFLLQLGFDIEYIRMVGKWKPITYERYLR
ncbi:hypothetical protein BT69DRAFT_1204217, partial [Atractiella rhizophila]